MIESTPFYLMFGRKPLNRFFDHEETDSVNSSDSERDTSLRQLKAARAWAWSLAVKNQQNNKLNYDKKAKPTNYDIGNYVYVRVEKRVGEVRKLVPKYVGPFKVMGKKGPVLYVVPKAFPNEPVREVHADRVRPGSEVREIPLSLQELQLPWRDPAHVDPNLEAEDDV
jgi:hypothetical protein